MLEDSKEKNNKDEKDNKKYNKKVVIKEDKKEYEEIKFNSINNENNFFYKYDPNDEDKEIGKFSANIIVPDTIKNILESKKYIKI